MPVLPFTLSQSLTKLISVESLMLSNNFIPFNVETHTHILIHTYSLSDTFPLEVIRRYLGFPHCVVIKNLPVNAGDTGNVCSTPGSRRSLRGRNGNPLQYSCLENPKDRGAWWATVHGVAKELDLSTCTLDKILSIVPCAIQHTVCIC